MSLKLVAAAAAVASAFALSACGDKKEAAPAKPATPAAPAAQSKAAEPLKVGFVYVRTSAIQNNMTSAVSTLLIR